MKGKTIIWIACLIYCFSPVDFLPGPLDDAIVLIATTGLTALMGGGKGNNQNSQ